MLKERGSYNEAPPKHELNGLKRGRFCRLKHEDGSFFWAVIKALRSREIIGIVEASFDGGPRRGSEIRFEKQHIFEIN